MSSANSRLFSSHYLASSNEPTATIFISVRCYRRAAGQQEQRGGLVKTDRYVPSTRLGNERSRVSALECRGKRIWLECDSIGKRDRSIYHWIELATDSPAFERFQRESNISEILPATSARGIGSATLPAWFYTEALPTEVRKASALQDVPEPPDIELADSEFSSSEFGDSNRFSNAMLSQAERLDVGLDLYSTPDFDGGLTVYGRDVAMKLGGFVKADFIYDLDPIDNTDAFDTTTIPVGAPPRTNSRFHARQTRLSFDTRWASDEQTVRIYVEGDFFSEGDHFRLRQAYGEVGSLLVGRTWTTFTDVSAAPATLDSEGSVSSVNRRQALARWTQPILHDDVTLAVAIEDTRFIIDTPVGETGDPRSPSPDFVARVRLNREWGQFQIAHLLRIGGFQPTGGDVLTSPAWGFNFTGAVLLMDRSNAYYQISFGDGIGSYRGLPDAAPTSMTTAKLLGLFGWMVGVTHDWNEQLSSNFTCAENSLDNTAFQDPNNVHRTTYLAANLIWSPLERVKVGIEYLYGLREDIDLELGTAKRLQAAFIFDLP